MMSGGVASVAGPSALYTAASAIWDFENNANDTKGVKTLTAQGTPTYGTTTPPQGSYYTILNGSSQYFSMVADTAFDMNSTDYSFSCWLYVTDGWEINIARKNADSSAGWMISGGSGDGVTTFQHVATAVNSGAVITVNQWQHFCMSYDASATGAEITYWVSHVSFGDHANGLTVAMAAVPTNDTAANLWIGRADDYIHGNLDEVVIWKGYELTATDAANLFAKTWR